MNSARSTVCPAWRGVASTGREATSAGRGATGGGGIGWSTLACRDAERRAPDPGTGILDRATPRERLRERFCHRVRRDVATARLQDERLPESTRLLPVRPLNGSGGVIGHGCILNHAGYGTTARNPLTLLEDCRPELSD